MTSPGRPIDDPQALLDLILPDPPPPRGRDLLVRVAAVSVNPRDVKSRKAMDASPQQPRVLGYDASGMVEAVGPECVLFQPGDAVMYAGVLDRQGSNAELQLVDERIVGRKPMNLDHADAASLPLTSLTAYELLFDRMKIPEGAQSAGETVLIVGGGGGVPSMAIQLARAKTELTVVASASRPVTEAWVRECGAHHVVDHSRPMLTQLEELGIGSCAWIVSTHTTAQSWADIAAILAPQGGIGLIDDPPPLDLLPLKFKSGTVFWEAMFTRPMFSTLDMVRQHEILDEVARLVEHGRLRPIAKEHYDQIKAANLRKAHAKIESGSVVGKIVLSGF
jgi:NADPH:quinone reductase